MKESKDIKQEIVREVECGCDVSVRAKCPVCSGSGKKKVYFCAECGIRLSPGLDGNLCDKCFVTVPRGVLAELAEKGSDQFMKEEPLKSRPEMLKAGVMDYIKANAPWSNMTHEKLDKSLNELGLNDKKLDEFLEAAFGPSELETYWKRGGWVIDRGKGVFTKGELCISIEAAVELRRTWEIGPDEKIVPGMVAHTEVIRTPFPPDFGTEERYQRVIQLLRRWTCWESETSEDHPMEETMAFLKEIHGVDPS